MGKSTVMIAIGAATFAAALCAQAPKPAASPEDVVRQLEAAIKELNKDPEKPGSLEPILAVFPEPVAAAHRAMFELCPKLKASEEAFRAACDKQFGKDSTASIRYRLPEIWRAEENFREELATVTKLEIIKKEPAGDDRVLITVRADVKVRNSPAPAVREERHLAVRQADGWKLMPEKLNDPARLRALKVQVEAFKKGPETMDRIAKEVGEGRYVNREEAQKALYNAFVAAVTNLQAQQR
jgi:hypothetical protein